MSPLDDPRSEEVVRLTKAAVQAAESGQWDVVIRCYQDRGVLFDGAPMSLPEANNLLTLDGLVRERAQTAQVLLQSLIEGSQATRAQLQGLRQRLAGLSSAPERMSLEA